MNALSGGFAVYTCDVHVDASSSDAVTLPCVTMTRLGGRMRVARAAGVGGDGARAGRARLVEPLRRTAP
jgi:hypothetical protein